MAAARTTSSDVPGDARRTESWLDQAPGALALPTDRPRPDTPGSPVQALKPSAAAHEAAAAVASLAGRAGTTSAAVLLAAFRVFLARTADEHDLVVGCGSASAAEVLVVRAPVDLEQGMGATVRTTAAALATAEERGASTVGELVHALGVEPGRTKHPVFQVGVALDDTRSLPVAWPVGSPVAPDLTLVWHEEQGLPVWTLQWLPELFDRRTVERWQDHLARLLVGGAADSEIPVGLLPLMGEEELARLRAWNDTAIAAESPRLLVERVREQARRTPDAVAVEHAGSRLTYAELVERSHRLAGVLRAHGAGAEATVAVSAARSLDMAVAVLAALTAGAAYVPLDPDYPADRRQVMLADCGAAVLLTQTRLLGDVPPGHPGRVVLVDDAATWEQAPDPLPSAAPPSGTDLAYVLYTSGSTGSPKGVAMPQSALVNLIDWQLARPQFRPAARTLQFSSLSFDVSFQEIFSTWCSGGVLVLVDEATRRDPRQLLAHLVQHRVERLFLPYVALRGLASAVAATGQVPESLREVYTAGEQLQVDGAMRELFRRMPSCRLENQYGPTETHVVTASTLGEDVEAWPVLPPIGRPIANCHVHVLDRQMQRRPPGVPGELYVAGACLARGYLGRPDMTQERFVAAPGWAAPADRLYRTGDLVRWLPTGELAFLGRLDQQVKLRGHRIEPGEISAVLAGAPGVEQCVALVRDGSTGPRLTAYLVAADGAGAHVDVAAVHRFAKQQLPAHMVPTGYLAVRELPLTSSGKIDTAALPDVEFDRSLLSSGYRAPASPTELAVSDIWSALLGVRDVGLDDDFFELGGDSLVAVEMVQQIEDRLGYTLPMGALAQAPTVGGLARLLGGENGDALWRSLVPLQPGEGDTTPLFLVHGGSGNVASFPRLTRELPRSQPVYALQWDGLHRGRGRRSIPAMARHYLAQIRDVQPSGPYLLAGQCIGGLVAREMTHLLLAEDEQVALLVMYDSPNLASADYVPKPSVGERLRTSAGVKRLAFESARGVYRRRPRRDPVERGAEAMRRAAWRYRPRALPEIVPTHFVGSGESRGEMIALDGTWTDGAMGWASAASSSFAVHRLRGNHNEVLYDPAAVAVLRGALERAHEQIALLRRGGRSPGASGG